MAMTVMKEAATEEDDRNDISTMQRPERSPVQRAKQHRRLDAFSAVLLATLLLLTLFFRSYPNDSSHHAQRNLKTTHHFKEALATLDFSEYSCDNLYQHTMDEMSQRCAYAQTCNDGDGIFAPIVYCSETYSTRFLSLCLGPPLILFLIILFRILGSTAEEFFSPGLETMSLEMGLPERFAGVTLLALGNGAPDVASTVNAILHDRKLGYLMALGELTGAAMVASTVIVGAVTFVANGVSCRGALVRDVIMFIITMIVVYMAFDNGTISPREIHVFVIMYLVYVVVVLAADVYHRKIVVPRILARQQSSKDEEEEEVESETALLMGSRRQSRSYSVATYELEHTETKREPVRRYRSDEFGHTAGSPRQIGNLERVVEALSNYDVAENGNLERSERSKEGELVQSERTENGWGHLEEDGTEPLMVFHPHHGGMVDLKLTERFVSTHVPEQGLEIDELQKRAASRAPESWAEAWTTAWPELKECVVKLWRETYYNDEYNALDKFLMTCELPFMVLRMLTIPVPCDGYYCRPLLALSIALSPLWLWYYFWDQFSVDIVNDSSSIVVFLIFFIPFLLGLAVLRFAPCGDFPPRLTVAVPITLIGFCVSATWLDLIADLLVSLLSFFGIICRIPSTIMGLTVLAWGNSSQDMIANMTVARKGLSTMAITASFAGPVFNILVGLGIGLTLLYSMTEPGELIVVELNSPLRLGFLFSVLNGVLVIFCGVCVGRGFLPKRYGYVAMALYFAYVVASLTM